MAVECQCQSENLLSVHALTLLLNSGAILKKKSGPIGKLWRNKKHGPAGSRELTRLLTIILGYLPNNEEILNCQMTH